MLPLSIRQATESDLHCLVSLDAISNPHPWGESLIFDALQTRKNWLIEGCEEVSIGSTGRLLGWLTASQWGEQSELELVVISIDVRRRGLAKKLMSQWLQCTQQEGVSEYLLEVRESNMGAIHLYESLGFELVGRRKNYYQTDQGREAACLFTLKI